MYLGKNGEVAMKDNVIVGLDIGTTKICVVVGEKTSDGVDIVGVGTTPSLGLRKGVVVNIEQTVRSIKKAVEDAEVMSGHEIKSVYTGIAGTHIMGFNSHGVIAIKGGEVTQKDIERVIDAARAVAIPLDKELIHVIPQEFIVDDQRGITDPLGMAGVRLEVKVYIVTGAVTSVQNIIRSCHRAGLDLNDIVLESLASSYAVLSKDEREIGVALVDIGGGTTDLSVFYNDTIKHIKTIPLGGGNLTNDIAFGLRTSINNAELIKKKHGCALADLVQGDEVVEVPGIGGREAKRLSKRILAEICEPRVEEILSLVDQELISSGYKNVLGAGVVLTGGGSMLDGIVELAEQIFGLPVRIGIPQGVGGLKEEVNNPKFSTAVGLLLYGAQNHKTSTIVKDGMFKGFFSKMKKWFSKIA